jgi:hypothetical protein
VLCSTALTRKEYTVNAIYQDQHILLGNSQDKKETLLKAVLDQQWQGIPEYSTVSPPTMFTTH